MAPRACRFYRQGDDWFCGTGLPSDIVIEVEGVFFHLHKFPLLSKCGKIARMIEKLRNTKEDMCLTLVGCPGGPDAFLFAAQFCYGVRVELTPKNILMVYCAAEYLEMTEQFDEENLLAVAESFFHKVIFHSWKDCILALHCSEHSISNAETLHIVSKCLNALSTMACTDPSLFGWPMMMYGSLQSPGGSILWNGINTGARIRASLSDWWFEDISCLGVPMFKRLIETMKERGIRSENIAGALMYYSRKYLPGLDRWQSGQAGRTRSLASFATVPAAVDQKLLLESIEKLLPQKKGKSYCRYLLGLLRVGMILNVCQSCRDSLERRIGMQLELATLDGLLIPNFSDSDYLYDTDCVERIIHHFVSSQELNIALFSPSSFDPATSPSSSPLIKVTKLIDSFLAEVAPDVNLKPKKMQSLLLVLPEALRSLDDGLYRALDIYFKAHPWLSEKERVQLCSIIDYGKLSIEAYAHASHNECLPLRIILQVLFFEQLRLRTALSHCLHALESDDAAIVDDMAGQLLQRDGWVSLVRENRVLRVDMERMRSRVRKLELDFVDIKQEMGRVSRPHNLISSTRLIPRKLGCMPVPKDLHSDAIESTGPSPRRSTERPYLSH
ncbi:BTB/POZ domain-containing protein At3g44820 isoform X1 [Elaeis guineensis]|uniref:BTB/POZ domain-containing protein At3g44820 n=2 Tax=Elaeis guineensis var. tenera TaxID=51953 RepID=A0A6J0PE58_ELAGV|nr:BTB/POZ domain-containing protein At3g44820 [Elaeis guineensis]XP_029118340.1 BTB/POZ domain-containing protein At3g44820 [Elaeis guineensis]